MPDELDDCLGETGERINTSSQRHLINERVYLTKGACLSICVNFMCNLVNINLPTKKEQIDIAQWIYADKASWQEKVDLLTTQSGLRKLEGSKGQLLTDEIYLVQFLRRVSSKPSFNVFSFYDNTYKKGHALLFYTWEGDDWILYDPNFGMAKWTHLGGLLVGLKKLLSTVYAPIFGPYFPYWVDKYEK
jgi:hypothetical protein